MQNKTFSFLGAVFLAVSLSSAAFAGTIVKMTPLPPNNTVSTLSVPQGEAVGWKYLSGVDLYIVDDDGKDVLNTLQEEGRVEVAEENTEIQVEAIPNDPMLGDQGWAGGTGLDIGAEMAWDVSTGDAEVTVAIIDTGISVNHPDLAPNLWTNDREIPGNGRDDDGNGFADDVHGFNFWSDNGDVTDENNHGSHLAGVIGAVGDDGVGIAGVCWKVRLMPLRFTDEHGSGTTSKAIEAIDYAIRNGARIINASWTLKLESGVGLPSDSLLAQAIQKAADAGILFVTASGNQFRTGVGLNIDRSAVYPASFGLGNIVSVAALDGFGELADYSDYGPTSVDLAAPGAFIYSTGMEGSYVAMTGTSIATAVVSGAAALVLSVRPDLTPEQLKGILEASTVPGDSLVGKVSTGGELNLYDALSLAKSGSIPETPPPASRTPPAPTASESYGFPASGGGCSLIPE